jgi:hypothetical protein
MRALTMLANFALVMATVYFAVPVAFHYDLTLSQSAAITLLSPEPPEVYLVNGQLTEEDAE